MKSFSENYQKFETENQKLRRIWKLAKFVCLSLRVQPAVNSRYKKWQTFVVNSSLRFEGNVILVENNSFRSLPLLVAAERYRLVFPNFTQKKTNWKVVEN